MIEKKKIWAFSLHTLHLLVVWKTVLSVLFVLSENPVRHEQLNTLAHECAIFSPGIWCFLANSLIIPITLQKVKDRKAWCEVKSHFTDSLRQSTEKRNRFPIQVLMLTAEVPISPPTPTQATAYALSEMLFTNKVIQKGAWTIHNLGH